MRESSSLSECEVTVSADMLPTEGTFLRKVRDEMAVDVHELDGHQGQGSCL